MERYGKPVHACPRGLGGYPARGGHYGSGGKQSDINREPSFTDREPPLITEMKRYGINPLFQENYLLLVPSQQGILGTQRVIDAVIGNIEAGIDHLHAHNLSADKLEKRLEELKEKYPSHFSTPNGKPKTTEGKSDFNSARRCMNS